MSDERRTATITFRITAREADALARLGFESDNSRSNICFCLVSDALITGRALELFPKRARRFEDHGGDSLTERVKADNERRLAALTGEAE